MLCEDRNAEALHVVKTLVVRKMNENVRVNESCERAREKGEKKVSEYENKQMSIELQNAWNKQNVPIVEEKVEANESYAKRYAKLVAIFAERHASLLESKPYQFLTCEDFSEFFDVKEEAYHILESNVFHFFQFDFTLGFFFYGFRYDEVL